MSILTRAKIRIHTEHICQPHKLKHRNLLSYYLHIHVKQTDQWYPCLQWPTSITARHPPRSCTHHDVHLHPSQSSQHRQEPQCTIARVVLGPRPPILIWTEDSWSPYTLQRGSFWVWDSEGACNDNSANSEYAFHQRVSRSNYPSKLPKSGLYYNYLNQHHYHHHPQFTTFVHHRTNVPTRDQSSTILPACHINQNPHKSNIIDPHPSHCVFCLATSVLIAPSFPCRSCFGYRGWISRWSKGFHGVWRVTSDATFLKQI